MVFIVSCSIGKKEEIGRLTQAVLNASLKEKYRGRTDMIAGCAEEHG